MTMGQVGKASPGVGEVKIHKNGSEDLAAVEAKLAEKRKQKEALDAELAKEEEEMVNKLKEQAEKEKASKLELAARQEEEAEFLLSQAAEAAKRAKEIREQVGIIDKEVVINPNTSEASGIKTPLFNDGLINTIGVINSAGVSADEIGNESENPSENYQPEPKLCVQHKVIRWIMRNIAMVQIGLLAFCLLGTWGGFKLYEAKINAYNASLDETEIISEKINPFNDANIQRVFFEKGLEFMDVGLLFIFLLILAPTVLLYIVPFINAPQNFAEDFTKQLSPWQRVQSVLFLVFALLLYFGLKAVVNTF
jgi:hypothetical protein